MKEASEIIKARKEEKLSKMTPSFRLDLYYQGFIWKCGVRQVQNTNTCIVIKGTLSGLRQFLATKSPLKTMKSAFYFTLEALFFLKILSFYIDFLVVYKNGLIRKIKLILKFMTSQPGSQTIVIHILPSISRHKRKVH